MKKTKMITWLITILLIAIVPLSFTKCVTITHHPSFNAWSTETWSAQTVVSIARYSPIYICILTSIQLILLWASKKNFTCWIGILLDISATAGPFTRATLIGYVSQRMGEMMYDYTSAYNTYSFSFPVFLIIVLGITNTVLYFLLFRSRASLPKTPEKDCSKKENNESP